MLVKRYQVKDMQEAMDTVIKELGSDAVILSSRKVRKKGLRYLFQKPVLEVMVAYDPAKVPMAKRAIQGTGTYGPFGGYLPKSVDGDSRREEDGVKEENRYGEQKKEHVQVTGDQLKDLDERISSIDHMLGEFMSKFSFVKRDITYDYSEGVEELFCSLIESQVREELAHSLSKQTDMILKKEQGANAAEVMQHLILEQLGTPEPIQPKKFNHKVVLFIGPTGVGKTTSLVKLAANFSVKQKKKVGIINTDTYRIAAQEQLKAYADILSIPLGVVYQSSDIGEALEAMSDRELIFIDTAGKKPGDEQHREDISQIIEVTNPEDIMLCVAASTSFASLKEIIDTYSFIEDYKIVVTKLDETKSRGMILNLSWYAKKSLAYVTTGQNVPDDIENIDMETIAGHLLKQ